MAKRFQSTKEYKKFVKDLYAVVDDRVVMTHLRDHHTEPIVDAVIASAVSGIGPGNRKYPAYSPAYAKKKRQAGSMRWLRGIGNDGRSGGMLDPKNFSIMVSARGNAALVWHGPQETYPRVHQEGLPLGKNGPRKKRKWLHFDNPSNAAAVRLALGNTFKELVAQFNANRKIKQWPTSQ